MKNLICVLSCLSLAACSSTYKVPMARMLSPESEDPTKFSVQAGYHQLHDVTITSDILNQPISTSHHPADPLGTLGLIAGMGIFDRLDLSGEIELGVAPLLLGRFQILGESKRTAAPGNFSFSVVAGIGARGSSDQTSQSIFSNVTTSGTVHRDENLLLEAGLIAGYRFSTHFLLFAGTSVLWQTIEGSQSFSAGGPPNPHFIDHSRYTEMHLSGIFNVNENTQGGFFFEPALQWGWTDSFGNRSYLTAVQADVGLQF